MRINVRILPSYSGRKTNPLKELSPTLEAKFFILYYTRIYCLSLAMNNLKVLVANRGEISGRILAAAREQTMSTVAIYSEEDRFAGYRQRTSLLLPRT